MNYLLWIAFVNLDTTSHTSSAFPKLLKFLCLVFIIFFSYIINLLPIFVYKFILINQIFFTLFNAWLHFQAWNNACMQIIFNWSCYLIIVARSSERIFQMKSVHWFSISRIIKFCNSIRFNFLRQCKALTKIVAFYQFVFLPWFIYKRLVWKIDLWILG